MRIATLASGSGGNCALVSCGGADILIDAGISFKRIKSGLSCCGIAPEDIGAVLITHEHSDHIAGLRVLAQSCACDICAPRTLASRLRGMLPELEERIRVIVPGESFRLGEASVTAFRTMHDTPESVGYRIDAGASFGMCTDLGEVTDEVLGALAGVDAAVVEFNHDEQMLRYGRYPVYLKRRILSERGHLSNEAGARLAVYLAQRGARELILGHLSRENNTPEKALEAAVSALEAEGLSPSVRVAPPAAMLTVEVRERCLA